MHRLVTVLVVACGTVLLGQSPTTPVPGAVSGVVVDAICATIVGLPSGTYRLAAVDDVREHELKTSSWLESIHDAGVRITIAAGQETRQDVRVR